MKKKFLILIPALLISAFFLAQKFPVVSKVLDSRRLQETNFEMSILEFKGENLTSVSNPAKAFFKYEGKIIPLRVVNKDLHQRIVVELPRYPEELGTHFLDGELVISGGDIPLEKPQTFPILLVRQPKAQTRLEKMKRMISDAENLHESELSRQMGQLISKLQAKYRYKIDFRTETKRMDQDFVDMNSELDDLNIAFNKSLEELEEIDQELRDLLS